VPKKIFITGASAGIGKALSEQYALLDKNTVIGLVGRNKDNLLSLSNSLPCKSIALVADVSNIKSMKKVVNKFIKSHGLPDIVIANAGVSSGTLLTISSDIEKIKKIFDTNFHGVINTFHPFINKFIKSNQGHLVAISSVAGIRGLPGAGAYSASKAALINYMESIRVECHSINVNVTTILPGYVKSNMTDANDYPMPFIMSSDEAAKKIINIISKKKRCAIFPWQMAIIGRLMHILPSFIWDLLAKNGPKKKRNLI